MAISEQAQKTDSLFEDMQKGHNTMIVPSTDGIDHSAAITAKILDRLGPTARQVSPELFSEQRPAPAGIEVTLVVWPQGLRDQQATQHANTILRPLDENRVQILKTFAWSFGQDGVVDLSAE